MLHDCSPSNKIISQAQTIKSFLIIVLQSLKSKHFLTTIFKNLILKHILLLLFLSSKLDKVVNTSDLYLTDVHFEYWHVHSCQQKSIGLKFSKSQTGSDMQYSCHHNLSRFTFPIFAHLCHFSVLHSLQSVTPRIY